MARSVEIISASPSVVDELEKYQRLVALQKQIIALDQSNQRAQQACLALREQVASEVFSEMGNQRSLRKKPTRRWQQWPEVAPAKSGWNLLSIKEQPAS